MKRIHVTRALIAATFVLVWIALGFALSLDSSSYLLIGIPLTLAFQLLVAKRPIHELWWRERVPLDGKMVLLAIFLALTPGVGLAGALFQQGHKVSEILWSVAAVLGVWPAAVALRSFRRMTWHGLLTCFATAGVMGVSIFFAKFFLQRTTGTPLPSAARAVMIFVGDFFTLFPVIFVLEEVAFRGALDAYVRPDHLQRWPSAIVVSVLWGLWHLPLVPSPGLATAALLIGVHTVVGVPLSFAFRRTGNLAVPGVVHAFIDAVRNSLLG